MSTVDEYLAGLAEDERSALERVRSLIRAAAPDAEERLLYKIPAYKLAGDLVGFAAQPKHLSFYTMSPDLASSMRDRIAPHKLSGGTIHFSADDPLPDDLVTDIVTARVAENEARQRG